MFNRMVFAVLLISLIGCTQLKERFGTGEETPELRAARSECRSLADKETLGKYENSIKESDQKRVFFDDCMEKKGYNQYGRKVK